jgi:hypothetical protein
MRLAKNEVDRLRLLDTDGGELHGSLLLEITTRMAADSTCTIRANARGYSDRGRRLVVPDEVGPSLFFLSPGSWKMI